jgi:PadR family transcriptional regulator, regulatory protein PadR
MARGSHLPALGEFELLVLLAIMQAGDNAYGTPILDELAERAGRTISRGALYVTLDRLEAKGYVTSRTGDASASRGGRPRRYYTVRPLGMALLRRSLDAIGRMQKGLALDLKHPRRA